MLDEVRTGRLDDLDADNAVLLASTVIEVNADFFTRQVMPRLSALFAQVGDAAWTITVQKA